jgi:hypothetical protein
MLLIRENNQVLCCRIPLYGIKHAACGGADVAKSVFLLGLSTGPIRVLRAAWRPCSRGRPDVRW